MSAPQDEPVAWMWLEGVEMLNGTEVEQFERIEFSREKPTGDAYGLTPLYSTPRSVLVQEISAEAIRAAAIAECAKVCERMTEKWVRRHSQGAMGQMCGLGEGTASDCVEAIRALSPRPTVSEEWIREQAGGSYATGRDAIRVALQSLGYEVTK